MASRLFHQNMLNFGGGSRVDEFANAFRVTRRLDLGTDDLVAIGYTEIKNKSNITYNALNRFSANLMSNNQNMNGVILFAAGANIFYNVQEYIAISIASDFDISLYGYTFPYVSDADPKDYLFKGWVSKSSAAMLNLPDLKYYKDNRKDLPYSLASAYRGVAFVFGTYNRQNMAVGFMHNVCSSGDPGVCMEAMPAIVQSIRDACEEGDKYDVILGGDFNVRPHNVPDNNVPVYSYRARAFDIDLGTTSANCLDFWISNSPSYDNDQCHRHSAAYNATYRNRKRKRCQVTDHRGISLTL